MDGSSGIASNAGLAIVGDSVVVDTHPIVVRWPAPAGWKVWNGCKVTRNTHDYSQGVASDKHALQLSRLPLTCGRCVTASARIMRQATHVNRWHSMVEFCRNSQSGDLPPVGCQADCVEPGQYLR